MSWFFQKTPNCLFECHVKVRRGKNAAMPSHLLGAFVTCFSAAPDYQSALKIAVAKLASQGYIFEWTSPRHHAFTRKRVSMNSHNHGPAVGRWTRLGGVE